jgi:hypothetical protein
MTQEQDQHEHDTCPSCDKKAGGCSCPFCVVKRAGACVSSCAGCSFAGAAHHVLRYIIGFIIILFVFWFGVKVGELKTMVERQYGTPTMMHTSSYDGQYNSGMMYNNGGFYPTSNSGY